MIVRVLILTKLLMSARCQSGDYTLTILHVNDVHSRFEETNVYSGRCSPADKRADLCYGGMARIRSAVEKIRSTEPHVLFLSGGDYFQGTIWYTIHKWRVVAHFLNMLHHDAMALGNHEFDDGVGDLSQFMSNVTFPLLAANIVDDLEPQVKGKYAKSVVIKKGDRNIGIIGYVTTETKNISNPGHLTFTDEVEAVKIEARGLRTRGVNIVIALGHAGYRRDLDIAMQVEDVDVVVGGHTNTFLYTGAEPSTEKSADSYPTVVVQRSGRKVPVVQAYAFGKYLGNLQVTFDSNGEVTGWTGNPILLDNALEKDAEVLKELVPWRDAVAMKVQEEVGRTFVFLDGRREVCRLRECSLGNVLADAIVHQNAKYPDGEEWAHTSLAVVNSGGIRASIDEKAMNGSITIEDLLTVAPFMNTIDLVVLHGSHVKEMFEWSVFNYDRQGLDPGGGFLQVSGFHVLYDLSRPSGSRVVKLQAKCVKCRVPRLEDVEDDRNYTIAVPSYLANGGDGYWVIRNNKILHHLTGLLDTDIFVQYIRLYSPIYQGTEGRIMFVNSSDSCHGEKSSFTDSNNANRSEGSSFRLFLNNVILTYVMTVIWWINCL